MKRKICFVLVLVLICAQMLTIPAFASYLPGDTVVYITATGDCYHKRGCGYLHSRIETTLAEAVNDGYRPCSRCRPGRLDPDLQTQEPSPVVSPSPDPSPSPSESQKTLSPSLKSPPRQKPSPSSSPSPSPSIKTENEEPNQNDSNLALAGLFFLSAAAVSILYLHRSGKKQEERLDRMRSELHSLEKNEEEKNRRLKEAEAEFRADEQRRAFEKIRSECVKKYGQKPIEELCAMPQWVEIGTDGLPKDRDAVGWGDSFTYYMTAHGKCVHKRRGCCGATSQIHAWIITKGTPLCSKCCKKELPDLAWYDEYLRIKAIKEKYNID